MNRREFARDLVQNQEFLALIEELRDRQFAVIETSAPEEVKQREHAYALLRAFGEMLSLLEVYAQSGAHEKGRELGRVMTGTSKEAR
jgi:hypothetical protein